MGGRWRYGPPPPDAPGYRPGYTRWRRGAFLPRYYQEGVVSDYWRHHLRRPPSGYNWVRAGDTYLLVSTSTGLIFDVVEGF